MAIDLAIVWAGIIAFAVLAYVVLDGFDLGVGILFPFFPERAGPRRDDELRRAGLGRQRDLAGAGRRRPDGGVSARLCHDPAGALRAHHRHAARLDLPRRRVRISLARPSGERNLWDWAFAGGSMLAAFAQGVALGALVQGIPVDGPRLCRRLVGLADAVLLADRRRLVVGYALPGATWLVMKTEGELAAPRAIGWAWVVHGRHARRDGRRQPRHAVPAGALYWGSAGSPGRRSS